MKTQYPASHAEKQIEHDRHTHNPNCDGGRCRQETGEVRALPSGGDSNLILCQDCFNHELGYRRDRNRELGEDSKFELPLWDSLAVYGEAGGEQ